MFLKRPIGIVIFGGLLIITSIYELYHIPSYSGYKFVNREFPERIIAVRYYVSYILRVFGLACGAGVICLNDNFRKILIGLCYFSISTIYLRHTYKGFLNYTTSAYYQNNVTDFSLQAFTWMAVIVSWSVEVSFCLAAIYYFSRPGVVKYFIKGGSGQS
ncbi:MAG: hypothetical protein HQL12_04475 [Candidatus Omnitrophica bacterium]|nr:hypothetical protein [Candidatus Omnitrophota bacterium]